MNNFFLTQVSQIDESLYLASLFATNRDNIRKYGIDCVITVCKEAKRLDFGPNVEIVRLNIVDSKSESLIEHFDAIADKIRDVKSSESKCLVHCVGGVSRSPTMIMAYLMKHERMSLRDAFCLVRSKRKYAKPNVGFWHQLIDYERRLFNGASTVRMIEQNGVEEADIFVQQPVGSLKDKVTVRLFTLYSIVSSRMQEEKRRKSEEEEKKTDTRKQFTENRIVKQEIY